jgi:hypothetical protein
MLEIDTPNLSSSVIGGAGETTGSADKPVSAMGTKDSGKCRGAGLYLPVSTVQVGAVYKTGWFTVFFKDFVRSISGPVKRKSFVLKRHRLNNFRGHQTKI